MEDFFFAPFPDGKTSAIALTFDDGSRDQLLLAAPELEKRHWRGTFFISPESAPSREGKRMTRADFAELLRRGHELGNHTMTHCDLQALALAGEWERLRQEIHNLQQYIRELSGRDPQSFTAPWGRVTPETEVLTEQLHLLGTGKRIYAGKDLDLAAFRQELDEKTASGQLAAVMFHGISPEDNGWKPFPDRETFLAVLDIIGSFADRAWIGPFGTAAAWNFRARHAGLHPVAPGTWIVTADAGGMKFPGGLRLCPADRQTRWSCNGKAQNGPQNVSSGDVIRIAEKRFEIPQNQKG